ncbi:MAG: sensor histidine kinase [Aristaeellaceae bacterium]
MTMVLLLVVPVSVMCMALTIGSIFQSIDQVHLNGNNGLGSFLDQVALRYECEGTDPLEDFPSVVAGNMLPLFPVVSAENGAVYVSCDREQAFLIHADGTWEPTDESYTSLLTLHENFVWDDPKNAFQVVVVCPRNYSLKHIPSWYWFALLLSGVTPFGCLLLYRRLHHDILVPMEVLGRGVEAFKADHAYRIPDLGDKFPDDFLRLNEAFNNMVQEVELSHEKDIRMLEGEMDNMRLQVNPHLLLNSLNMIYALAQSKNTQTIQEYALCLGDYFRYVLRRGQQLVSVRQELDFVDNFIHIQRIRFPDRFSYVYQASDSSLDALIPPLLIENFVENAIKYALKPDEAIEVVVSVHTEETDAGGRALHIAIMDTGSGIRPDVLACLERHEPYVDAAGHRHIGIYNCVRRIELFYGEKGDVHFTSGEQQGTQAYIVIPCVYEEPQKGRAEHEYPDRG